MPDPTPWKINPPTSDEELKKLIKLPSEYPNYERATLNEEIVRQHTRMWFPEMNSWRVQYDQMGIAGAQQVWIAPYWVSTQNIYGFNKIDIPIPIRQLVSWNREKYQYYNMFWDTYIADGKPFALQRPLVVSDVELIPRPELVDSKAENLTLNEQSTTLGVMGYSGSMSDKWQNNDYSKYDYIKQIHENLRVRNQGVETEPLSLFQQVFPRARSQYWQVNLVWRPDPYVNRFGIRYAKMEMSPNLRMESLKNASAGVVPTKTTGQPEFEKIDPGFTVKPAEEPPVGPPTPAVMGNPGLVDPLTTGFPVREPQVTVKLGYRWVSLERILKAGPIGNASQLDKTTTAIVSPEMLPDGMHLGCVNKASFLGYPRGRVLYNSAALLESTSPVTGKIGYEIIHEFLINPLMEWNQTRYSGDYNPFEMQIPDGMAFIGGAAVNFQQINENARRQAVTAPWKTGFIVLMDAASGFQKVHRVAMKPENPADSDFQAVYPYPYKDLNDLLYYGIVGDGNIFPLEG